MAQQRHQPAHWVGGIPVGEPTQHGVTDWTFTGTSLTPESELMEDARYQIESLRLEAAELSSCMLTAQDVYDVWWRRATTNT